MKAMYITPAIEIIPVGTYSLMQSISGPGGMTDGGQAGGGVKPQAPGKRGIPF